MPFLPPNEADDAPAALLFDTLATFFRAGFLAAGMHDLKAPASTASSTAKTKTQSSRTPHH